MDTKPYPTDVRKNEEAYTMERISGLRPFQRKSDLERVLRFVGQGNLLTDNCGWLHVGDVCHNRTKVDRPEDPEPYLYVYEQDERLDAIVLFYAPNMARFQVLIHPDHRNDDLERRLLEWSSRMLTRQSQNAEPRSDALNIWVMNCDVPRQRLLAELGFIAEPNPQVAYTTRSLSDPVPDLALPTGFSIRETLGEGESIALGTVHGAAFNSDWSNNAYRAVMQTRAYSYGHELLVVAPSGELAAFLIYWPDPITKNGLFEPVGCHHAYQRRGLTRQLMYEAMRRMSASGMTTATVKHSLTNPAAANLYASVGFTRKFTITDYHRPQSTQQHSQ
jgi:ribosomal protein S18 acetylase RimI-like enzyme